MAHDEAPIPRLNVLSLVVAPEQTGLASGTAGRLIASGSKLYFDTGTALEKVTSA